MDYYNQLLRLVYRLLVLFVAEDRGILFDLYVPLDNQKLYLHCWKEIGCI